MSANSIPHNALNTKWLKDMGVPELRDIWIKWHYGERSSLPLSLIGTARCRRPQGDSQPTGCPKGEPDMIQLYDGKYKEALAQAQKIAMGMQRTDTYRTGMK